MTRTKKSQILSLLLVVVMTGTVFMVPLMDSGNAAYANEEESAPIVVTLDPAGGAVSVQSITAAQGGTYAGIPDATRAGYKFQGWFASDGTQIKNGMAVNPSYTTLTAKWQANKYTVKYNKNKGKLSKKSKKVTFGAKYGKLPTPKRSGYKFLGWYTKKKGGTKITKNSTAAIAKKHTVYARWGKITTVKFNANSGTVSKKSKKITQGKKYGTLPKPKRSGYDFKGWYTKKKGGNKVTASTVVKKTKNSTLYARWVKTPKGITVTLDAGGGSAYPSTITVKPGKKYGTLPTAYKSRSGLTTYRFLGWYTSDGTAVTSDTIVKNKSSHTLYARYMTISVRIY